MIEELLDRASFLFMVSVNDMRGPRRLRLFVRARQGVFMALRMRGHSYPTTGRWMCRNHASVINGVRRAEYEMQRSPIYRAKIERLAAYKFELKRRLEREQAE